MYDNSNSLAERLARLEAEAAVDRISSFPPDWDRWSEPRLVGTLELVRDVKTINGQKRIAEIRRLDGTLVCVWLSPTKLQAEWAREAPVEGELLQISFHGDIPVPGKSPMADIRVRVDRAEQGQAGLAVAV